MKTITSNQAKTLNVNFVDLSVLLFLMRLEKLGDNTVDLKRVVV